MITTHPLWDDRTHCEADLGGAHSATPAVVLFDSEASAFGQVRLWQSPGSDPVVEVTVGDMDSGKRCRADFALRQVRQLRDLLTLTLAKVDG